MCVNKRKFRLSFFNWDFTPDFFASKLANEIYSVLITAVETPSLTAECLFLKRKQPDMNRSSGLNYGMLNGKANSETGQIATGKIM